MADNKRRSAENVIAKLNREIEGRHQTALDPWNGLTGAERQLLLSTVPPSSPYWGEAKRMTDDELLAATDTQTAVLGGAEEVLNAWKKDVRAIQLHQAAGR